MKWNKFWEEENLNLFVENILPRRIQSARVPVEIVFSPPRSSPTEVVYVKVVFGDFANRMRPTNHHANRVDLSVVDDVRSVWGVTNYFIIKNDFCFHFYEIS